MPFVCPKGYIAYIEVYVPKYRIFTFLICVSGGGGGGGLYMNIPLMDMHVCGSLILYSTNGK